MFGFVSYREETAVLKHTHSTRFATAGHRTTSRSAWSAAVDRRLQQGKGSHESKSNEPSIWRVAFTDQLQTENQAGKQGNPTKIKPSQTKKVLLGTPLGFNHSAQGWSEATTLGSGAVRTISMPKASRSAQARAHLKMPSATAATNRNQTENPPAQGESS